MNQAQVPAAHAAVPAERRGANQAAPPCSVRNSDRPQSTPAHHDQELQALRAEVAHLHAVLDSAVEYAIITLGLDGRITGWSRGAAEITGHGEAEALGQSGEILFTEEDRADRVFTFELCRALENGRATNQRWHLRRDGTRFWASGVMLPLLGAGGTAHGFVNILRDRTDLKTEVSQRQLVRSEMNHRMKNVFATVRAVASQTDYHAPTQEAFQDAFHARLAALSRSHDLLIRSGWEDAPLREVVDGALAAYAAEPDQFSIEGIPVLLPAEMVVTVSLAFHELATNAAKHGALSTPEGAVAVSWTVHPAGRDARRVEIIWRERGGPSVTPPGRRGFGLELLEHGLYARAKVQMNFQAEGLECRMFLPLGIGPVDHEMTKANR